VQEGAGDNPMRYAGGMLGGTWLASLTADQGDGVFDGAHLVQNFENLHPANTFWDKCTIACTRTSTPSPRTFSSSGAGGAASPDESREIE
jgi:hypothetical protein